MISVWQLKTGPVTALFQHWLSCCHSFIKGRFVECATDRCAVNAFFHPRCESLQLLQSYRSGLDPDLSFSNCRKTLIFFRAFMFLTEAQVFPLWRKHFLQCFAWNVKPKLMKRVSRSNVANKLALLFLPLTTTTLTTTRTLQVRVFATNNVIS